MALGEDDYFDRLSRFAGLIARGNYDEVGALLEMTGSDAPPKIAALAEAIGHMVVQLEAREWRLELLIKNLLAANVTTLELLGAAIAKRDSDTSAHNFRVTVYAVRLAEAIGADATGIRGLIKGAFLHDVGKIAIPDQILLKPGRLDEAEFAIMRTHVDHGVDIVGKSPWLEDAVDVVRCHHEKFDGSGYVAGLAGEAIPLNARIFAIADVFDALTSRRPYKEPMSVEKSLSIISESAGSHFDPALVAAFLPIAGALHAEFASLEDDELVERMRGLVNAYFEDAS